MTQMLDETPFQRAMAILADAGVHSVKITGTAPSGHKVTLTGGAPKPRPAKPVNRGGGL